MKTMQLQSTSQFIIQSKLETKTRLNSNLKSYRKPLTRLCSESHFIYRNTSQIQMNNKAEWHQPAVPRLAMIRELEET